MNEIEEMQKIICDKCICIMGVDGKCSFCLNASKSLYEAGYRKYESEFVKQEMNVADKKLIEFLMANKDSELPLKEFLQEYIKGENEDERD